MIYSSCIAAKAATKFKKNSLSRQILSSILICLFCLSYIPLNANAAEPKVNYFRWASNVVEVNKAAYFEWNISNVSSCTSTASGAKSTSGRIGPIIWTEPRESTTKWHCTDLNGNRYPSSGYLEAHISVVHPRPKVKRFSWSPSVTTFGKNSYFYWDIENVTSCTSTISGTQPTNGRLGPYRFSTPRDSTTKWSCTDLNGDRYPTNGYLEARHEVYPSASKNTFAWSPSTINVGETSTLVWDIRNVTECRSTTMGTKIANNNNVSDSATGGVNNTVGFINERFSCKDLSGSWVYYDAPLTIKPSEPNVVKFGWSPSPVDVGVETSFEWQIDNVTDCTSLASGPKASSGTIGPMKLYGNGSTSTTQWHCKDLGGDRYPPSGYLEATRTVENPTNAQHIDITFTNSNSGSVLFTTDKLIAEATSLVVDGNMTDISSVSFRYLKVGTLDILDTVAAVENNNTFTSTFENNLTAGSYILQVVVDGISQSGLSRYFTVFAEPNVVKFDWSPSTVDVGDETSFEWQIDNVKDCTSLASGPKASNGTIGPMKLYGNSSTSTTQWHCKDLGGDRYPPSGYLEATRIVQNLTNAQHIDITFTNSNSGSVLFTTDKLIAEVTPLVVDGNMTDISSVSFRYLKVGTLDILDTVVAAEINNTFTSTFENNLTAGNYILQVVIDGISQSGLSRYFTVTEDNVPTVYKDAQGNLYIKNIHNAVVRYIKLSWVNSQWIVTEVFEEEPPVGGWGDFESALVESSYVLTVGDFNNDGIEDFKLSDGGDVIVLVRNESDRYMLPTRKIIYIHTDLLGSPVAETNKDGDVL